MRITIDFNPDLTVKYDKEMLALESNEFYAMLYDAIVTLNSDAAGQYSTDEDA
jgi:hypothetical protein